MLQIHRELHSLLAFYLNIYDLCYEIKFEVFMLNYHCPEANRGYSFAW